MSRWPRFPLRGVVARDLETARALIGSPLPAQLLAAALRGVLLGFPIVPTQLTIHGAWRARRHGRGTHFDHVSELWYPRADLIKRRGRLNPPSRPLFYCSPFRQIAGFEVGAVAGDWVTCLAVAPIADNTMTMVPLGVDRCSSDMREFIRWVAVRENQHLQAHLGSAGAYEDWCAVDDFLADLLTQVVADGEEEKYLATNLLAEWALSHGGDVGGVHGILYPSVATQMSGVNLCLTPEAADRRLVPVGAHVFEMIAPEVPTLARQLDAVLVASAAYISPSGLISWAFPREHSSTSEFAAKVCGPVWVKSRIHGLDPRLPSGRPSPR
jgi:hypothetical protein